MPTRRGLTIGAVGAGTVALGRTFGIVELFVIGVAMLALGAGAWAYVRFVQLRLEVSREVTPLRVHARGASRVELRVSNLGRARTPVLELTDPVTGTRGARVSVAPMRQRASARAAYRLPTDRRGIIGIGPLTVRVQDAFGLAAVEAVAAARVELTVYPHVDELDTRPGAGNRDPHSGAEHPNALGHQGEDFYSLRPYETGDDLRRVHWPSTARNDELMVRQDELPWQGRTTVLLDTRRAGHEDETFEAAVSAAASIVTSAWHRRDLIRLVTTDGTDSGTADGHAHIEAAMEYLAVVEPHVGGSLASLLSAVGRSGGGSLVVVFGRTTTGELETVARAARRFGSCTAVVLDERAVVAPASITRLVQVSPNRSFKQAWEDTSSRRSAVPA